MKTFDSNAYWEERYQGGETSGCGSRGQLADWKAEILNKFVEEYGIRSVIELGCGDGYQLALYRFYEYVGFDVSPLAVKMCSEIFSGDPSKTFGIYRCDGTDILPVADMTLSADVLFHITDREMLYTYLIDMFSHAGNWVVFYAYDHEIQPGEYSPEHYQPMKFTEIIKDMFSEWVLYKKIPNKYPASVLGDKIGSDSEFFIYRRY